MDKKEKQNCRKRWREHKHHTKGRMDKNGGPIEFKLTFDDWLGIWLESGHLHERGRGKGQYVMARINDTGNYEVGNVEIKTSTDNNKEGNVGKVFTDEVRAKISAARKGKKRTSELRAKISAANKARSKLMCPHCGKACEPGSYARWHGDNCKIKAQAPEKNLVHDPAM